VLSVTPTLIIAEFERRGMECNPVASLSPKTVLEFVDAQGARRYIHGCVTDKCSGTSGRIVDDKLVTAAIAQRIGMPVPDTVRYESMDVAREFLQRHGRIVVKPLDSAHGNGVSVGIDTEDKLKAAIESAQQYSDVVLLQQMVFGKDVRLLYIGNEFCAASERRPAGVTGDGVKTIRELIEQVNLHPERGENYQKKYNRIPLDVSGVFLAERMDTVPANGEEIQVIGTANIGSGGAAIDMTDSLPAELIEQGRQLADELRAGVCGVDFIVGPEGHYLIEANASPSFGLHHYPHEGQPRDVTARFVDWLLA